MSRAGAFDPVAVSRMLRPQVLPFSEADMDVLFTHLMRCPAFLAEARQTVRTDYFDPGVEAHWAFLWDALCAAMATYGAFTRQSLLHMLAAALDIDGSLVTPEAADMLLRQDEEGIVHTAYMATDAELHVDYARSLLRRFLHERTVLRPLRQVLATSYDGAYANDLPEFIDGVQRQQMRIQSLVSQPFRDAAPALGDPFEPPMEFKLTGVPVIDLSIQGQRVGDANGIIGVMGGGKTTIGVQLAVSSARIANIEAVQGGALPDLSLFFSYEEPRQNIEPRVWSHAFNIRYDKLQRLRSWDELTAEHNMEDYERQLVEGGARPLAERERWAINREWLNRCFRLYDMSGSAEFPYAGNGGVAEVASYIDRVTADTGQGVRTVVLDWAGLMLGRYIQARGMRQEDMLKLLTDVGEECRRHIAVPYRCTVWILHQMKAEAAGYSPSRLMTIADAKDSKAFATFLAACGCMGTADPATGCRRFNWGKVRYLPSGIPPMVVRINERFARMEDVSRRFTLDDAGRRFVDSAQAARVVANVPAAGRRSSGARPSRGPEGFHREGVNVESSRDIDL